MSGTFILLVGFVIGLSVAGVTFVFNSSTPIQLGPVPFFGGAGLAAFCLIALIGKFGAHL